MNDNQNTVGMISRIRRRRQLNIIFDNGLSVNKTLKGTEDSSSNSKEDVTIPPEFTPHQYAIFLLHVAAELEHVLMVQYLYAGYSLGGHDVPLEHQNDVSQWREIILGIAKEEMGHLMTIQNLLRCLGGPLNLDREDYPWDSEFYPFPFTLEPLSRESLAKYIVAESPADWDNDEAAEIRSIASQGTAGAVINRVGKLLETIENLFIREDYLKDFHFRSSTYPFQATWDEWGRGYKGGARGKTISRDIAMPGTPDVILRAVTSRTDSLEALRAVATQGEANPSADETAPSHFARFLRIFREWPKDDSWSPSRKVPENPVVIPGFVKSGWIGTPITYPESQFWAHLSNLRYHLLLINLLHTFDYPNNLTDSSQKSPRGLLIHATFGEMYNLRSISEILVQLPLDKDETEKKAAPTFQMPYTLKLPHDPNDRWRLHIDLLQASAALISELLFIIEDTGSKIYLNSLRNIDCETIKSIESILNQK